MKDLTQQIKNVEAVLRELRVLLDAHKDPKLKKTKDALAAAAIALGIAQDQSTKVQQ